MDSGEDQNTSSTNGNPQTTGNTRAPQIARMSLYERQAVQLVASPILQVNLSTTSAGGTMSSPRPHGPATSATTTALNQSVLLGGNSAGQGQMYLRVQNLALHCASNTKAVAVKAENVERKDAGSFPLTQQQQNFCQTAQQQQLQLQQRQQMTKASFNQPSASSSLTVKTGNQAAMTVTPAASVAPSSSSSSPALPLSQLLLSPSAAPVILVPTSNVTTSTQGYPIGSVAPKANMNPQTLVVQPLQQPNANVEKGPVPIQPKTAQGHRLPLQLSPRQPPPILPAPPNNNQPNAGGHNPPHIPVQLVGARQGLAGNSQAVALAQARSTTAQESPSGVAVSSLPSGTAMTKPTAGSLKRKSDSDAPNEMSETSDSAPMKDSAPPLSPAPTKDSALPVDTAFSSPPTLSLPLPLSRVGHGDKVPQAVVKPQVLTHLIEGFVIQEGAEPFPVAGLLKDRDFALVGRTENGPPSSTISPAEGEVVEGRHNLQTLLRTLLNAEVLLEGAVQLTPTVKYQASTFLSRSSVLTRLVDFLLGLGCEELAAQFLSQEIDGQALLLLREDHLISTMNIKLGPALKICASINSLRE
ncbi:hypothetical protein GOODEAATRI_004166 [Goodea atripinnis]|uniref:SAM domain-containing protein n=1 Tax=Goodea atripinnis TaxID=208336 RepID=A0ABV0P1A7_9TELE